MKTDYKFELLVAAYAHDLKNQLQALTEQQDSLVADLPEEFQLKLAPMINHTNKIKEDTLRLVSLYRLENTQQINRDDAWPHDTANQAIESCLLQFPNLIINNHIESDSQGFYNDQLAQLALVTLITNSAQAEANQIDLRCEEHHDDSLTFIIQDNGPGFNQAILDGSISTTKAAGTGLGLHFVEMICRAHQSSGKHGKLSLSNNSSGAEARLFLP